MIPGQAELQGPCININIEWIKTLDPGPTRGFLLSVGEGFSCFLSEFIAIVKIRGHKEVTSRHEMIVPVGPVDFYRKEKGSLFANNLPFHGSSQHAMGNPGSVPPDI